MSHERDASELPANLLTQWARLLVHGLCAAGAQRFVISPGSRNTPLVAAILDCPSARHWVVIDERAAGFFALAQAKRTGQPSVLVCTSGSAVGHYLPAILEAERAHVPLIALSADRPAHLQANCAPQTTDQVRLFGSHVRGDFDLAPSQASTSALLGARRKLAQAVALSRYPVAGPVHLNVPANKPLEPQPATTPAERALAAKLDALLQQQPPVVYAPRSDPSDEALQALLEGARGAARPVLVLGPDAPFEALEPAALRAFANGPRWPVWCEVTNQARWQPALPTALRCDAFDLLLQCDARALQPDLILQLGAPPTSAAYARLVASATPPALWVASRAGYPDPENRARGVIHVEPSHLLHALTRQLGEAGRRDVWQTKWEDSNRLARRVVDQWAAAPAPVLDEAQVLWELGRRLASEDLLLLGNSLPVRVAETFLKGERASATLSQRGVNGIDGMLATAAGAASIGSGRVVAVLGDVTALHDIGSLQLLSQLRHPLLLLIVNNRGGRIFDQLPVASLAAREAWTTPHAFDLQAIASAFGVEARRVETRAGLAEALHQASSIERPFLVEARVAEQGALRAWGAVKQQLRRQLSERV